MRNRRLRSGTSGRVRKDMAGGVRVRRVQSRVPTTEDRQRAIQEDGVYGYGLRESLRQHEYTQWASLLTRDLARREARISDHVWKMYREESVTEDIARSYIGASEFIKRSQRHVR